MGEENGTNNGAPSLPGGNEYTSLLPDLQSWGSHTEECGVEPPGDPNPTYAEAYRVKFYGPQAFPVNVAPTPTAPNLVSLEPKDLKEMRKTVTKDGANSFWAVTRLQEAAYHLCPQGLV